MNSEGKMSELYNRFSEAYKALEQGDVSKMEELFAEDIVFTTPERTMHGRDEAISRFKANQAAFAGMELHVDYETMVVDAGDSCAVEFVITGRFTGALDTTKSISDDSAPDEMAATGVAFSLRTTDHVWWRDGKIYRFNVYYDPGEMIRQLKDADAWAAEPA
jgi:ketosteroid isomerase-like protein